MSKHKSIEGRMRSRVNQVFMWLIIFAIFGLWMRVNFLIDATTELDRRIMLLAKGLLELKGNM